MSRTVKVDVQYLTRIEGHGNIVVNVRNGKLEECKLDIVESPRFFEGMLRGRSIFEAQHITSRICGICACAHSLASIQAAEDAIGFVPSEQTKKLRKLLLDIEILDSHLLHTYFLASPDLLGVKSFVPLIDTHGTLVRRALRMKKACNDICEILVGRHIHPISCIVGGFTKIPRENDIETILNILYEMRNDMDATVELAKTLKFPDFTRETEYIALVNDTDGYPMIEGDIGSTDGMRINKHEYRKVTNEFVVRHSSTKHAKASRESYMVGALARFNLNSDKLHPKAKMVAGELGMKPPIFNPFLITAVQVIESVHCLEEAIKILEELQRKGTDQKEAVIVGINEKNTIPVRAGVGVGAVEAPRGTLFHCYEVDGTGKIINADCVIPTSQNINNIERDMRKLVPEILDKPDEEITLMMEMLVRAYDPCISCSTHFLDVKFIDK
ncbi:MAG: Ni/Fe hydrogenase subunit alpha [Bacillota bacterium]|nr:Ni/Fe hydrogenase subunit alpha [Bacillota bacterium]